VIDFQASIAIHTSPFFEDGPDCIFDKRPVELFLRCCFAGGPFALGLLIFSVD